MNLSIDQLFISDSPASLRYCIESAQEEAVLFMSKASFIKSKHDAGCKNRSLPSTAKGALNATCVFSEALGYDSSRKFVFFGERISEAIQIIKSFMQSKR